jgi:hypothetical protein
MQQTFKPNKIEAGLDPSFTISASKPSAGLFAAAALVVAVCFLPSEGQRRA